MQGKKKGKGVYSYLWKFHHTATECHLPYGITICTSVTTC